jgi:membrane protein DedA with SNARE-associated domain
MHLGPFILFTVLGSIPWNLFLVLAGYLLGENWLTITDFLKRYEYLILAILVIVALGWIWLRFVRPWLAARKLAEPGGPGA